ncbi:MAG: family 1 encapsulin nanocompartment shell protein [Acidimicrobiales bacterium]
MNHLYRELAPISEAGWQAVDQEATSRVTTHLAARKLVDFAGPHGWEHSATNLGRSAEIFSPSEGVAGSQRRVLPLVELRTEFRVSRAQLDDAERGATDIELDELDEAVRQIAVGENVCVFHGYQAAGIRGITESSSHAPIGYGDDMEQYVNVVARAADVLRQTGIDGPYGMAICPQVYTSIVETTEHGGYLLLDHLRQILGGPLVWAPGVDGGIVLSLRGGDFILDCGQDLSIGYLDHDVDTVRLYLEESFSFRVDEPDAAVALIPGG